MKSNGIVYFFKQSFRYFWSNKVMSFASVGVLATCLFIMCSFMLVSMNLNKNIKGIEDKNEIVCFIDEAQTPEQVAVIGERIKATDNVSESKFVSKAEALASYTSQFDNQADLFSGLDENPLRDSYSVKFENLAKFDVTMSQIEAIEGVSYIRSSRDVVDGIMSLSKVVGFFLREADADI
ncbi:MAG: permease-like cell division protein FtsX, partial [Oscillospiraceae bacterium]